MERSLFALAISGVMVLILAPIPAFGDRAADLAKQAKTVTVETCEDVETLDDCHPAYVTGCSKSENPRYDPYLNFLKDQVPMPDLAPTRFIGQNELKALDLNAPSSLGKRNHASHAQALATLGEANILAVIGYLYYAQVTTTPETSNCQLRGVRNSDFHIGIGFDAVQAKGIREGGNPDPAELEQASMVVEMTPHYRAQHHPKWTIGRLRRYVGWQVKVIGQLMVDNEHANAKENCGHPQADRDSCWRASAWELHPVTQFYICPAERSCSQTSTDWRKLDDQR